MGAKRGFDTPRGRISEGEGEQEGSQTPLTPKGVGRYQAAGGGISGVQTYGNVQKIKYMCAISAKNISIYLQNGGIQKQ